MSNLTVTQFTQKNRNVKNDRPGKKCMMNDLTSSFEVPCVGSHRNITLITQGQRNDTNHICFDCVGVGV